MVHGIFWEISPKRLQAAICGLTPQGGKQRGESGQHGLATQSQPAGQSFALAGSQTGVAAQSENPASRQPIRPPLLASCKQTHWLPSGPHVPGSFAHSVRVTAGQIGPWQTPLTQI
jgi:hypothetical protein